MSTPHVETYRDRQITVTDVGYRTTHPFHACVDGAIAGAGATFTDALRDAKVHIDSIFEFKVPGSEAVVDISGREAVCSCGKTAPSSPSLAFFEYRGEHSRESLRQCECGYSDVAHRPEAPIWEHRPFHEFKARGGTETDRFYCGCRGFD